MIDEAAGRGDVVLVSHGASIALGPRDDVLRVLVTASPDTRERRHGSSVRDDDRGRADYLKRFYDVEREQPTHYDLVVNTDTVEETKAADLITHAALRL